MSAPHPFPASAAAAPAAPTGALPAAPSPVLLAPGEGDAVRVLADVVTTKVSARETRGAFSLFESRTDPGVATPLHRQPEADHTFVVLEGRYRFDVAGAAGEFGTGAVVFVPRGTAYGYANVGGAAARLLVIASPGGIHERFLAEVGGPVVGGPSGPGGGPPDVARVLAAAARHGIEVVEAAPAA